jgi:hypothetical protein
MLDKITPKAVLKALASEAGPNRALDEAEMHFHKGRRLYGSMGGYSGFACGLVRPAAEPDRPCGQGPSNSRQHTSGARSAIMRRCASPDPARTGLGLR